VRETGWMISNGGAEKQCDLEAPMIFLNVGLQNPPDKASHQEKQNQNNRRSKWSIASPCLAARPAPTSSANRLRVGSNDAL
jgi:hypothetical protein